MTPARPYTLLDIIVSWSLSPLTACWGPLPRRRTGWILAYALFVRVFGFWIPLSLSLSLSPSFLPSASPGMVRWFSLSRALSYHHQAEGFGRRSYEHSPLTRARQVRSRQSSDRLHPTLNDRLGSTPNDRFLSAPNDRFRSIALQTPSIFRDKISLLFHAPSFQSDK